MVFNGFANDFLDFYNAPVMDRIINKCTQLKLWKILILFYNAKGGFSYSNKLQMQNGLEENCIEIWVKNQCK